MNKLIQSELELSLISNREEVFEKIKKLFQDKAIEAHVFGSLARGEADAYSDIDIWFTFDDSKIEEIIKNRFEYYAQIGQIIHICEPPQNAPINGMQTSITYKTEAGYLTIDCSLCPLFTSLITEEGKKLFGIDLPIKSMEFNPQKIKVPESYRIDFFIIFIMVSIKKFLRHNENPFDYMLQQYAYLYEKYAIPVSPLVVTEQNFTTLKQVIENVRKVATDKQQIMLDTISNFIKKVE